MPDLGKYLTELPEALTLDDDDILYTVVGSETKTSKKVKKSTILSADRTARATAEGTIVANFASPYNTTTSYAVGDYCIKDLVLYKCTSPTSGTWDSSKWTQVTALDLTSGVASDLADEIEARQSADETLQGEIDELPIDVQVDGGTLVNEDNVAVLDSLVAYGESSGEIATFSDGSDLAMKSLKVAIEPQQDLHGYDYPWPAGGGKNKVNIADMNITSQTTLGRVTLPAGTYVASATVKNNTSIGGAIKINTSSETLTVGEIPSASGTSRVSTASFTLSESTEIVVVVSGAVSGYNYDVSQVQIELGTTATSYAPYSNICPISGWDECKVSVSGVNVWDEEWEEGSYDNSTGEKIPSNQNIRVKNAIIISPNTQYYLKSPSAPIVLYYDANNDFLNYATPSNNAVFTTPSNAYYMRFRMGVGYGTTYNNDISINYPSSDTSYHAYNGQTYTIDLGSTRYGGTLDAVSGVLTMDRVKKALSANDAFVKLGDTTVYLDTWLDIIKPTSPELGLLDCSHYKEVLQSSATDSCIAKPVNNRAIIFYDSIHATSVNNFKAYITEQINNNTPIEVVYKLATPQTYQLTPTEVKTLLGINNIWADTGDIQKAEYVRDLSTIINYILEQLNS